MALYAQYNFDEGSGTTAADLSGNNRHLAVQSGKWTSAGHTNACLEATGASYAASGGILPDGNDFTVMFWVKPLVIGTAWRSIIQGGSSHYIEYNNGEFDYYFDGFANSGTIANFTVDTWYHIAIASDAVAKTVKTYINGTYTHQTTSTGVNMMWSSFTTYICGSFDQQSDMRVDDLRTFTHALTEQEVVDYMNTPVALPATANAGTDQTVEAWSTVTLIGSGSSAGVWSQVSGQSVTLTTVNATTVTFQARPADTPATMSVRVFRYTVGGSSDDVIINTKPSQWFYFDSQGNTKLLRIKSSA